jgi:catechol 2,3-dioxygenase
MDAANPSALPTAASRAPLHVAAVALTARDLDRLCAFYSHLLGLAVLDHGASFARLGVAGIPLLHLEHRPQAAPDDAREAGLYHTAFLMPTRGDLARWILHMARGRVAITGASDHGVSEAIYLDDPEGNGIEVYHDRPSQTWAWTGDQVRMVTEPLDIEDIVRQVEPGVPYPAAPEGLRIGHVHLRVGDVAQAETFYRDALGLEVTRRRHGATFMSTGRYHHHIAGNVWHSAGAGRRNPDRAGLAWVALEAADASTFDATAARLRQAGMPAAAVHGAIESADPWGTRIRLLPS